MGLTALFVIGCIIGLYFMPTILANANKKRNKDAIFVLNLLLGWTFVGWVVALVWAVSTETPAPKA